MKYLLIAFGIAIVLSPLLWLRPSPRQLRITAMRKRAAELGLRVQLVPAADAAEDDRRPSAVRYLRPLPQEHAWSGSGQGWTLLRTEGRGWASPWQGWRWLRREAPGQLWDGLAAALPELPGAAKAVVADRQGLSVYLEENESAEIVDLVNNFIEKTVSCSAKLK